MGKDINESKLIGGKRKNGHKLDCTCHICENMKNKARRGGYEEEVEKEQEKKMGGSKKKNGHRKDCTCPICKNMQNLKKKGGSKKMRKELVEEMKPKDVEEVEVEEEVEETESTKPTMEKMGGKKKRGNGHKPDCSCPICKNMRKKKGGAEMGDIEEGGIKGVISETKQLETKATDKDYDELDAAEKGQAGPNVVGGTRKRRGKKGRKTRKARKHH